MFTYFAQAEQTGVVKIGLAGNPVKRLKNLQSTSPDRLKLLGVIAGDCEVAMHKKFSADRLHGEWFVASERLMRFIADNTEPMPEIKPWLPPVGTRLLTPGSIGNLILGHRKVLGLTQQDLAEKVGTSRQWIVEAEKGHARAEIGLVLRVLNALDIPLGIVEKKSEPSLIDEVIKRCRK